MDPKTVKLLGAGVLAIGSSIAVGYTAAGRTVAASSPSQRAWHGRITRIVRASADMRGGVVIRKGGGEAAATEGSEVGEGVELVTDDRTRVRLDLDDGSSVLVDRGSRLRIEGTPRTMRMASGSLIADVAHIEGAPSARLLSDQGEVAVLGTKFLMTAADDRTTVEVVRGLLRVQDTGAHSVDVGAGQEGVLARGGNIEISPVNDLAQRLAFGERLGLAPTHNEDAELPVSGLGELRARRPGKTDEKDHAVTLASHAVKVRVVGNVARTEVDEVFANETDDVLEGIYRFPLPPGAQIERLSLEVDGKMVDGSFVDKAKGAAIFRGAIQNSIPLAPKPREEIIWVPGPWRDPALLEWQRGGRFELKIFPIPKRGSRRVVIAYTEAVSPVGGVRRYAYPLPQTTASDTKVGSFAVDVQVLGADPATPVRVRGYELQKTPGEGGGGERFTQSFTDFVPSGDLTVEYALADRTTDATAWGFTDVAPATAAVGAIAGPAPGPVLAHAGDTSYVALALRPKLPGWTQSRPRDVVIVVDAGRSMFGERFQRGRRLAVQLTQEMDRRDRVAVLACDLRCQALTGGFQGAGSGRAHEVDEFLNGIEPDGASDPVGAVRAAAGVGGHDRQRDLRVVVIGTGAATAGYRRTHRLAAEVKEALGNPRDQVLTVPIGNDADATALQEIARGGGGVMVPYAPGERLESAALDVLNATYGVTLRDVELTLPPGLIDTAPRVLAPIRAGSETVVAARLTTGDEVKGDVVLKGRVGEEPFEARYPIAVKATRDPGNAFVPRLYAAARIADRERDADAATPAARTELVALSQRFAVPSRFTSLLVLESEAMFTAFGIDRTARAASWTGETQAQAVEVATLATADAAKGDLDDLRPSDEKELKKKSADKAEEASMGLSGIGTGGGGSGSFAPPATATPAPAPSQRPRRDLEASNPWEDSVSPGFGRRGGRFMKRIWVRHAALSASVAPPVAQEKIAAARAALQATPDERSKHKELVRLLAANGAMDEMGEVLARWSSRDPLDADAIVARADLAARSGDRDRALRILDGTASSDPTSLDTLAVVHERAQDLAGACAFRIAAAEAVENRVDVERVARAVACERADGRAPAAARWLDGLKQRPEVEAAVARLDALAKSGTPREAAGSGDIVVDATWDGAPGVDLDVAVVDPSGNRLAWTGRSRGVRVIDAASRRHEQLGVSNGAGGAFTIELTRASSSTSPGAPVTGTLSVRALGEHLTLPFVQSGPHTQVARVQMRFESELVPADGPSANAVITTGRAFDRAAAVTSLGAVSVLPCAGTGVSGAGRVEVVFAPSGRVSGVTLLPPFSGTSAGACIAGLYRRASVLPFDGTPVTVGRSFVLPP